jgi:hypothetical protein
MRFPESFKIPPNFWLYFKAGYCQHAEYYWLPLSEQGDAHENMRFALREKQRGQVFILDRI